MSMTANGLGRLSAHVLDGKAEFEALAVRKDRSVFDKHVLMVKRIDANGDFLGHYCFMRDISEQKRAEEALRQAEQKYRAIVENAIGRHFSNTEHARMEITDYVHSR